MKTYVSWITAVMLVLALGFCLPASAEMITYTLQPGVEGKDAGVCGYTAHIHRNEGARDSLYVACDTAFGGANLRSYVEFDLSGLPAINVADVTAVRFTLVSRKRYTTTPAGDKDISLHKVTEDWIEGVDMYTTPPTVPSITWAVNTPQSLGQPTSGAALATLSTPGGITSAEEAAGGRLLVWDSEATGNSGLLQLVKDWLTTPADNFGLMVRMVVEGPPYDGSKHNCWSSDFDYLTGGYGPTGHDFNPLPKLEIDVIPEPGSVCLLLSGVAAVAIFVFRRRSM